MPPLSKNDIRHQGAYALADYVPFYFTPFSPMMLNINTGRGAVPRRPNSEICILVKRRQAIEPTIGHMKTDGLLARNWLKGSEGDAIHAVLCDAGHNLRLILAHLRVLFLALIVQTRFAGNPLRAAWQAMTTILGAAVRLPVPARSG
jgi:hypothetical protein